MKELNINGVVYAKYEIDPKYRNTLFLKVIVPIFGDDRVLDSERYYIYLIQLIEKTNFFSVSYLNVD